MSDTKRRMAILGAGPVGLEAALAAGEKGWEFTLYEAGDGVAASIRRWGHVRLFSPWDLDVSTRMRRHLAAAGVDVPEGDDCPTGKELVERVFEPVAKLPAVAAGLRLGTRVVAVGREGLLKHEEIGTAARDLRPFRLLLRSGDGREWIERADVVLDCTGTYDNPNALGDGGIPAPGEVALGEAIRRDLPDVAAEADHWAGRTTLLVGAGHSAQTAALDLAGLAESHPGTKVLWAFRGASPGWSPDPMDALPERSRLIRDALDLIDGAANVIEPIYGVVVDSLERQGASIAVTLRDRSGAKHRVEVDRILSLTGFVGDHSLYRQLQVHECYATSGPMKLSAALLGADAGDDCLDQTSHGAATLVNPEPGFFLVGSKSYGRNTTFLMRVGWQQVDEVLGLLAA